MKAAGRRLACGVDGLSWRWWWAGPMALSQTLIPLLRGLQQTTPADLLLRRVFVPIPVSSPLQGSSVRRGLFRWVGERVAACPVLGMADQGPSLQDPLGGVSVSAGWLLKRDCPHKVTQSFPRTVETKGFPGRPKGPGRVRVRESSG